MVAWDRAHRYETWQLTEHHTPLTFADMIFHRSCTVTHALLPYHKYTVFQLDLAADYCSKIWHCKASKLDASSFENVLKEEVSCLFVLVILQPYSLNVQHSSALLCYQRNRAFPCLSNYSVPGSVYIMHDTHGMAPQGMEMWRSARGWFYWRGVGLPRNIFVGAMTGGGWIL